MTNPRDHARHASHVHGADATDSHGATWAGRVLSPSGFEQDTGASDPRVLAALGGDDATWMTVAAAARFLVAVLAHADEIQPNQDGLSVDAAVDMALVTLVAPDGARALPAFTGLDALLAWDASARPVPVTAERLAQSAITEQCDVIVINPSPTGVPSPPGTSATRVLRPSQVWALAQRQPWLPPEVDPFVCRAVAAAVGRQEAVVAHSVFAGEPIGRGILGVELALAPGLGRAAVEAVVTALGEDLATDGEFRVRIDGLTFRLR